MANPNHGSQPRAGAGNWQKFAGHAQHAADVPELKQAFMAADTAARHHAQQVEATKEAITQAQAAPPDAPVTRPPGSIQPTDKPESYYGRRSDVQDGIEVRNNPASRYLTTGYTQGGTGRAASGSGDGMNRMSRPGNEPKWKDG